MLSALRTGRLYPPGNIPGTGSQPHSYSAAGTIKSMENFNDIRDLPLCSEVPQQTAPPQTPFYIHTHIHILWIP